VQQQQLQTWQGCRDWPFNPRLQTATQTLRRRISKRIWSRIHASGLGPCHHTPSAGRPRFGIASFTRERAVHAYKQAGQVQPHLGLEMWRPHRRMPATRSPYLAWCINAERLLHSSIFRHSNKCRVKVGAPGLGNVEAPLAHALDCEPVRDLEGHLLALRRRLKQLHLRGGSVRQSRNHWNEKGRPTLTCASEAHQGSAL